LHDAKLALAHQASYDDLTGLPNRSLFNDRITQLMASSTRHNKPFALLFVDLDRFKEVNDTLGHQIGDMLLREVSKRLQEGVRQEDTVARIGGDEFVVLLPDTHAEGAQAVAANLLARLREPMQLEQTLSYRPMASVGLSVFPQDGDTPDLLLRNADLAMYAAKIDGRNRMTAYVPQMSQKNDQTFALQADLAEAIEQGQLRIHFQPQCRLSDGALMGAEALVRWQRPGNGLVLPGEFIGLAEKCGLLVAIDQWVMNEALRQVGCWVAAGLWRAPWRLAVNQNVADLQRPDMLAELKAMLHTHGVSASALELEITEDTLLQHTPEQLARLGELRDLGVSVSIDDFGTGYSSLAYLRQLPVSVIKIDMSFVSGMLTNDNDAVLVRTIVDMAHNLGHTLVAEGIEVAIQNEQLAALGCELGQGYLFGKPVSADEFAARWLGFDKK
jgi:diguanylate cyclase (GGDEF)-like protein